MAPTPVMLNFTKRLGQKWKLLVSPRFVKCLLYKTFWLEMLVVSVLVLAAVPPARKTQAPSLRKQFLHGTYIAEASEGPGAAQGAFGPSQAELPERVQKGLGGARGPFEASVR